MSQDLRFICHNSSLGYKTRKNSWTQGLLPDICRCGSIQWRIMAFPDLAEALPSGFKKNMIPVLQKRKSIKCSFYLSAVYPENKIAVSYQEMLL